MGKNNGKAFLEGRRDRSSSWEDQVLRRQDAKFMKKNGNYLRENGERFQLATWETKS